MSDAGISFRKSKPGLADKQKLKDNDLSSTDKMQNLLAQKLQEITRTQKVLATGFSKKPAPTDKVSPQNTKPSTTTIGHRLAATNLLHTGLREAGETAKTWRTSIGVRTKENMTGTQEAKQSSITNLLLEAVRPKPKPTTKPASTIRLSSGVSRQSFK